MRLLGQDVVCRCVMTATAVAARAAACPAGDPRSSHPGATPGTTPGTRPGADPWTGASAVSEAAGEVPVLGVGRETMSTLQQTVLALLSMLQQHRLMAGRDGMGREAWSGVEASDRRTARQIRVADPDVRLMRPEEGTRLRRGRGPPRRCRSAARPDSRRRGRGRRRAARPGRGVGVAGPGFRDGFRDWGRDLDRGRDGVGALRGSSHRAAPGARHCASWPGGCRRTGALRAGGDTAGGAGRRGAGRARTGAAAARPRRWCGRPGRIGPDWPSG